MNQRSGFILWRCVTGTVAGIGIGIYRMYQKRAFTTVVLSPEVAFTV